MSLTRIQTESNELLVDSGRKNSAPKKETSPTKLPGNPDRWFHFFPFILALVLFLVTDCAINYTRVGNFLDDKVDNILQRKLGNITKDNPAHIDILALGTSRTNNGFDTPDVERLASVPVNVYNMGLPGCNYYLMQLVLEGQIKKYGKPKLILLEVTDFLLNNQFISDNNILYFRTLLANQPEMKDVIFKSPYLSDEDKKEIVFSSISGLYRYRSILAPDHLIKLVLKGKTQSNHFYEGWRPRKVSKDMANPSSIIQSAKARDREILGEFSKVDGSRLEHLLAYCAGQHIPVVMFEYPSHPSYQQIFDAKPVSRDYYHAIEQITARYHIPFVDLKSDLPADITGLFADTGHLSQAGAQYFAGKLDEKLFQLDTVRQLFPANSKTDAGLATSQPVSPH